VLAAVQKRSKNGAKTEQKRSKNGTKNTAKNGAKLHAAVKQKQDYVIILLYCNMQRNLFL
jgi:aspartate 1-decarboxylase